MSAGSPKLTDISSLVAITNISLSNAVRALHTAKGRLRFALYSGRIIHRQPNLLSKVLAALHVVVAANPALHSVVKISEPSEASSQTLSAGTPYISIDEDHALAVVIAFLPSLEAALSWTVRQYDQFESIGPRSNAHFLLASIKGHGLMLSIMASHVLLDGQSLHGLWSLLSAELAKQQSTSMPGQFSDRRASLQIQSLSPLYNPQLPIHLSVSDHRYWKWVSQQIKQGFCRHSEIPFQKSCRAYEFSVNSRFKRELDAFGSNKYTQYENFVAFFVALAFENTNAASVHVQCPVTLQRPDVENGLGYYLDSRPIFIDREDLLLGETQALIRSSIKRLMSLKVPWRDYLMWEYGLTAEQLHASPGVLISKFFADDEFELQIDSQPTQPVSEYDLRKHINTKYTIKPGQRALTDMSPNFSFQVARDHVLVLSNIEFIHDYH